MVYKLQILMINIKIIKISAILAIFSLFASGCGTGADARKYPPDPELRVKKNIEEGRGFRLMDSVGKNNNGNFEFASSNELWRASLDIIDFMPLTSVNYSGGIIITDWYSTGETLNESIKISIRFLTNEVRSDALDIKVFNKKCTTQSNCIISEKKGKLIIELKEKILKTAAIYKKNKKNKNFKAYEGFENSNSK